MQTLNIFHLNNNYQLNYIHLQTRHFYAFCFQFDALLKTISVKSRQNF